VTASAGDRSFDLYVRGHVPKAFEGSLIVAAARRHKDRRLFSRWHDSQADLFRIDLRPGKPGRIHAHWLAVDSSGSNVGTTNPFGYVTQPNHGINIAGDHVWATNLLFGAPLEIDLKRWRARRILRYIEPTPDAPQVSGTSHFAWSLDHRFAYFHQSALERETSTHEVRSARPILVQLDTRTGADRCWQILPPPDDPDLTTANFHSAFYFEENGRRCVGLLKTAARLETLSSHPDEREHVVRPMPASTIWLLDLDDRAATLAARTLPAVQRLGALALSHLDLDASGGDGFVLYANFKQADVAEETHGSNLYGESPEQIGEQYAGMTVEALNYGMVMRLERRNCKTSLRTFSRPYDPSRTSLGHSWLPINIELDPSRRWLFCSFSGFRPRLLARHIADAYPGVTVDPARVRYVPPLLMRFRADTLEVDTDKDRRHLSYAEPMAMTTVGDSAAIYVCTFSPETGLRIYAAEDLTAMVCHAVAPEFMNWKETHFRPDPAHMQFAHA
jgi:hypothetical protein